MILRKNSFTMVLFLQVVVVGYYFKDVNWGKRLLAIVPVLAALSFIITGNYLLFAVMIGVAALVTVWQWRGRRLSKAAVEGSG